MRNYYHQNIVISEMVDVKHSQANISKIKNNIGYDPKYPIDPGLDLTVDWFLDSPH